MATSFLLRNNQLLLAINLSYESRSVQLVRLLTGGLCDWLLRRVCI